MILVYLLACLIIIALEVTYLRRKLGKYYLDLLIPVMVYIGWILGDALTETKLLRSLSNYFIKSLSNLIEPLLIIPIIIIVLYLLRIRFTKNIMQNKQYKISLYFFVTAFLCGFLEAFCMPGLPE